MEDNVNIQIKSEQVEITKTDGQYILLRKLMNNEYVLKFSNTITDADVRRLKNTGVIEITKNDDDYYLHLKTQRFHSVEMLYLIIADLLKYKPLNAQI